MKYLLLIYTSEAEDARMTPEEHETNMGAYFAFTQAVRESGHMVAGEALQPTTTATTVRIRDGQTMTTDGPFAETKEQLGGFYMVDCADLDEAIGIAARIPGAAHGSIEVRPLMEFN